MGIQKYVVTAYNIMTCAHVRIARVYLLREGRGGGGGGRRGGWGEGDEGNQA